MTLGDLQGHPSFAFSNAMSFIIVQQLTVTVARAMTILHNISL